MIGRWKSQLMRSGWNKEVFRKQLLWVPDYGRSRHTVTMFLNNEKTHSAINNICFKQLKFISDQLYDVELVKSKIELREPIIVWFFILQYAKLGMLEFSYKKFCVTEKYEELEMDTDSLYLAVSQENLEDIILPEKRNECSRDCTDGFTANATGNFFPRTCCTAHKKHDKREPRLFKEELRCSEMLCLCSKTYCCYDRKSNKYKVSSKGLKIELWKTVEVDLCQSIVKC